MFEHHFGLRENPFVAGHHAKFVYPSPEHQEALAHLRYGIENREPFVLITGEVGTGKTTALYDALAEWQNRVVVALITNSALTRNELLEEIALRFGVPISGPASKPQILAHLERSLLAIHSRGDRAILLLDEAQNLDRDVLEELRLLSNLEVDGAKLVQLFLVGQPELEAKLGSPELRQLRQRITVHYRLQPLSAEDTEHYIHHRISVAGGTAETVFPAEACAEVHRITHGIPREINTVCSQALLNAFVEDSPSVGVQHVTSAVGELEFESVLEGEDVPEALRDQVAEAPRPSALGADAPEVDAPEAESLDVQALGEGSDVEAEAPEGHRGPPMLGAPAGATAATSNAPAGDQSEFDLNMIDSWMAELEEAKTQEASSPPPAAKAETPGPAASRPAPAEFARPPKPGSGPPRATAPPPAPKPTAKPATPVRAAAPAPPKVAAPVIPAKAFTPPPARIEEDDAPVAEPPQQRRPQPAPVAQAPPPPAPIAPRSLAEEQLAALPPRLRARLEDDAPPSHRSGGAIPPWMYAAAGAGVLIVVVLIVRLGPWSHHAPKPAAGASAPQTQTAPPPVTTQSPVAAQPVASTPQVSKPVVAPDTVSHIVMTSTASPPPTKTAMLGPATSSTSKAATSSTAKPKASATSAVGSSPTIAAHPAPAPKAEARAYGITVATYLQSARAESQRAKFASSTQLQASVNEVVDGGANVYQIVLGKFDSRAAAEKAADDLVNRGLIQEATVIQLGKSGKP